MTDQKTQHAEYASRLSVGLEVTTPTKRRMTADERDIETLKTHERVSIFWITESMRRVKLVDRLKKTGAISLDNSCGYPWFTVTYNVEVTGRPTKTLTRRTEL